MHHSNRSTLPCLSALIATALFATSAAAAPPYPIVAPPIAVGATGAVSADPLVPVPPETPCVVQLYTSSSVTGTFNNYANHPFNYAPPAGCQGPWNKVVFKADFNVTTGIQFDRTASVWIGGANIYFGTTQEPSPSISPSWHVERDVTDLSALLAQPQSGNAAVYNIYNSTYNGLITGSAELDFYPATPQYPAPRVPDDVVSLVASPGKYANIYTDGSPLTATLTFPQNIDRAYIDVIAQPQQADEFWYTCGPEAYEDLTGCGGTAFREAEVSIDGIPAGIVPISGWVFTGGIDPFLWEPIPGVQTLNFTPYRIDITPFAGLLDNGQPHTVSVSVVTGDPGFENSGSYFATAATLLLYQDANATQLTGALTQDVDSGVHPVQTNTPNPDGEHFTLGVASHHSLVTRGYLNTPAGRAQSSVVQDVRFNNTQHITNSDSAFIQDVAQTSTALQRSYGTPLDGPANATTSWSFPLAMNISVNYPSTGGATQTTTANQQYTLAYAENGPNGHYSSTTKQAGNSTDTLNFDASFNFTGNSGTAASQSYGFSDSRGACYSRSIASAAGAVTSVTDGAACHH